MTDTISDEARTKLVEILRGIDSSSVKDDDRWWETSTGAEFGRQKLAEIDALFQAALAAARADERNKALEDAANACEERFMKLARGDYLLLDAEPQLNDCVELADAIRAMKVRA